MQKKTLKGQIRSQFSKGINRRLRGSGRIPSVIYGHQDPVHISVDEHEFNTKFKIISENIIIKLSVDKKDYQVLVKDFQEDILSGKITHIDFYEIEEGKMLKTKIPVHTIGTPVGVKEGGIFEVLMHEIEMECLPKDIPEGVEIDVSDLVIGKALHIHEIPEIPNVKLLVASDQVICHVTRKREEKVEVPEEEVAEGEEAAAEGAEATEDKQPKKEETKD
ncbi:MAG: 50S ribosomal protein L25 [Spirochaetales bacterium]|nr:50S ribosomal protein L25 [Spirochaetales bacterium]